MKTNTVSRMHKSIHFTRLICLGLVSIICFVPRANAQFCVGPGYGTDNLHMTEPPRQWVPSFDVQYIASNKRVVYYLDFSAFGNERNNSTSFLDDQGTVIPYDEKDKFNYVLGHLGFKVLLGGNADEKVPLFFVGGGLVDCMAFNRYTANGTNPDYPVSSEYTAHRNAFGISLLTGFQFYLKPVILQLKGDLDFLPLPIPTYAGDAAIHTNTRLTVLVPLGKL